MSDFEEYIKVNYPRDYERQKRIYPDQRVEELYSEDYKMWNHQQTIIDDLKAQLNNMEQCYIQLKQEHNELIEHDTRVDRKQKAAEKVAEKYKRKVSMIADLLRDSADKDMTLKAIQTVIERVGEHV
jgi:hypothetical protein